MTLWHRLIGQGLVKAEEVGQIVIERGEEERQPTALPRRAPEGEGERRSVAEGQ